MNKNEKSDKFKWISVKESLPEKNIFCLVTNVNRNNKEVEMAIYKSSNRAFYSCDSLHLGQKFIGVSAWMLLPEPYIE